MRTPSARRKTLGGGARRSSAVPSRKSSMAPQAIRTSMPRQSFAGPPSRPSMAPRSSMRQSLKGPSNMKTCWSTVFSFLRDQQPSFSIPSLDGTSPPPETLLYQIATEIVQFISPDTVFTKQNFSKDFSNLLKFLNYMEKIPASSLSSPTAPHTWQRVLPALAWIVSLVRATTDDVASNHLFTGDRAEEKDFLEKLSHSYSLWLTEDDEFDADLIQTLEDTFTKRNDTLKSEISSTKRNISECESRIKIFHSSGSKLFQTKAAQKTLKSDLSKISEAVSQFGKKKKDLKDKLAALKSTVEELQSNHRRLIETRDSLEVRVENQEQSKSEIIQLLSVKEKRNETLMKLQHELESVQKSFGKLKLMLRNRWKLHITAELKLECPLRLFLTQSTSENVISGSLEETNELINDRLTKDDRELQELSAKELACYDRLNKARYALEEKKNHLSGLEGRTQQLEKNLFELETKD
ncbi:hypothetical protein GEMRC1_003517 [Eukaryota sp. GEM-RC1]